MKTLTEAELASYDFVINCHSSPKCMYNTTFIDNQITGINVIYKCKKHRGKKWADKLKESSKAK